MSCTHEESEVYVVDLGVTCALGSTLEEIWPRLRRGESALRRIQSFETDQLEFQYAACVPDLQADAQPNRVCALLGRALAQLRPVPEDTFVVWAGLKGGVEYIQAQCVEPVSNRIKTGSTPPAIYLPRQYRRWVCHELGIESRGMEVSAACASSTIALSIGAEMIAQGEHSCVLICAADIVSRFTFTGFAALRGLTRGACRPFDADRDGLTLGDGAAAMMLATRATVTSHGYTPRARLTGWGISNDANHITGPAADGRGLTAAIRQALERAALLPEHLEAWCAHGTGTVYNDAMELTALENVFGRRRFPIFSVKGSIGHTLGAAGVLEAAVCVEALRAKTVPAVSGLVTPEARAQGRAAPDPQPFAGGNILTTNSGFGGVNAALIIEACGMPTLPPTCARKPRAFAGTRYQSRTGGGHGTQIAVAITGGSWITARGYGGLGTVPPLFGQCGLEIDPSPKSQRGVEQTSSLQHVGVGCASPTIVPGAGRWAIPPRSEIFDRPVPRYGRFDDYTKLGFAAVALALRDAGLEGGSEDHTIGIVSCSAWESMSVDRAYYRTALRQGGALASPNLFSYTLPGIMQGECAVHFRLTGPTVCVGEDTNRGRAALTTALRLMAGQAELTMIAGWLDDPPDGVPLLLEQCDPDAHEDTARSAAAPPPIGGAMFVVLERHPRKSPEPLRWISYEGGRIEGQEISGLLDLFG